MSWLPCYMMVPTQSGQPPDDDYNEDDAWDPIDMSYKDLMEIVFAVMIVVGQVGLGTIPLCQKGDVKTFVLGLLLAAANVLIFLVR